MFRQLRFDLELLQTNGSQNISETSGSHENVGAGVVVLCNRHEWIEKPS